MLSSLLKGLGTNSACDAWLVHSSIRLQVENPGTMKAYMRPKDDMQRR